MDTPKITIYMTDWCDSCKATRRFLDLKGVEYETINVDYDEEAAAFVTQINAGNRIVPTLEIEGKGVYTNPSRQQLTELLNLV
ncbi:MAG: glutaredoxin domain-containing protein [Chloroflexota bacterium]|nr:NrdH-redoxin [Chloroflexota bacterium]